MRVLLSKPDALGDQLLVGGIVQALRRLQPELRLVWHVRPGGEAIAPLLGAEVFRPERTQPATAEAARLAAATASLVVLPYPLEPHEPWSDDLRQRVAWWAEFLRATTWDATILGLVNRTWVGDLTVTLASAPRRIGFAASPARQPLVNEARALAGADAPTFTNTLAPSFVRSEAEQLGALFAEFEPGLRALPAPPTLQLAVTWDASAALATPARIAIAPGVGGDARRAWGLDRLRQVAATLTARGATVTWIEGPGDAPYLEGLPPSEEPRRRRFGPNDLDALVTLLRESTLLICHDTAYVHLAAAVGVPTVAIYGAGQHGRFHPQGGRIKIVQSEIACAGCQWHCLWARLVCVDDVPVEAVMGAVEAALQQNREIVRVPLRTPLAAAPEGEALAVRRRLQDEILALNADRFARLQIIQSLVSPPAATPPAAAPRAPCVSVIIPMGRADRVAGTLASLAAQQPPPPGWEIVLVGVGAASVARAHPHLAITPVELPSPRSPAQTRIQGVDRATGEWLLFVDDDIELAPDVLDRFARMLATPPFAADASRPVGAVGCRLPGKSGRFFERLTDLSNFWAQQQTVADDREWLYSAAIFVRAEAYRRSGGFNPEFPVGEDVDLTRRIVAAGYRLRYEPTLVARHDHRRDTAWTMWRYFWRNGEGARYFFAAHGGACPFSVKTVWLKTWGDLQLNRRFQHARGGALGALAPLVWLNYLIVETSLEAHWQRYLHEAQRYRERPARAPSDATYVRAMADWDAGRRLAGALRYVWAVLQDFGNPVRR